ncbi:MAG: DUF1178 family protein [Burkholderiaceae bacterium]|uniref:DUF1178 family protein n=1 Tax=Herminiimonas contaminans TaxID=1111140 RepID=A0ABS0EQE3_9BURK|nr:DUF1178 family protein [Herminiimonas contaminans]MBF8177090.1 DUF1178 family protein [Herminiimonas contaminans]MBX9797845.1 DUF1178 family protein [Burkholderiaceae bacterium]
MKVYDLCCELEHRFEGWFASEDDFLTQSSQDLIACPMCGTHQIKRLPSSPRLNLSGATTRVSDNGAAARLQEQLLEYARKVVANTVDVGKQFAEEARRIHYKEVPEQAIRGVATAEECAELAEEGIDVMALPLPVPVKQTLQ